MSKYLESQTNMTEEQHLVASLEALGFKPEVHKIPVNLTGYHGDSRPELATVVIPRRQINSAANDIGFLRGANGTYQATLSQYDRGCGYNEAWLGKVAQGYTESRTMTMARQKGYVFQGKQIENGKVKLLFAVR